MANRLSNVVNRWETTTTAEMGSSALSILVTSTSGLTSPAYVVIEEEVPGQFEVVYFDGSWTGTSMVTTSIANRYLQGSAAGSGLTHPAGSTVRLVPVSQVITDLNDRISLHNHDGSGTTGAALNHALLTGLETDVHYQYLPVNGTRAMEGTLNMLNNDIQDAGAVVAGSVNTNELTVDGRIYQPGVSDVRIERLSFTMQAGTGFRVCHQLLGVPVTPGWDAADIFIVVHLHMSSDNNSWRLNTLMDGTGTNRSASDGAVWLDAHDDYYNGGANGGSGSGQIFSNAGVGVTVTGLCTYYLFRSN